VLQRSVRFGRRISVYLFTCGGLFLAGSAHAAGTFARGPFLQSLGATGVTVKVELLTPEALTVELTGPDGATKKLAAADARRFQSVRLDGLSPGTGYRYKVLAGEKSEASDEGSFTTAPAENKPFKLIVYGDSRSDPAAHAAVVRAIEAAPSDFLVNTGDLVAMGDEEDDWRSFFAIEHKLLRDRCVFASIGNHELAGDTGVGAAAFLRYFASGDGDGKDRPKLYGSFRWSNTRFFLLNAMDNWAGEERAWLKEELDRALVEPGLAHRFAVLHHGPYSSGPHGSNERLHKNGVMQILRDGKVDLVIAGHDHAYERGAGEGIKYVVSGGAGAPLYPRKNQLAETLKYESVHHFVEVSVDGDKVDLVARRASGSVLESCGFVGLGTWDCDQAGPAGTAPLGLASPPPQTGSACSCAFPGSLPIEPRGALGLGLAAVALLRMRRAGGTKPPRS
jgi:hypothetical protein